MNRYKIKVKNKEQADEAQELFSQLGFNKNICSDDKYPKLIVTEIDYSCGAPIYYCESSECEGLSFDQLRALVSLHKKPINMDKVLSEVRSDALGLLKDKEYLRRNAGGTYSYVGTVHPDHVHDLLIEIPEGAIKARFYPKDPDGLEFENNSKQWWDDEEQTWVGYGLKEYANAEKHSRIVWQRHTQPEPLPFMDDDFIVKDNKELFDKIRSGAIQVEFLDDEPSLNDQYAEIEQVRQETQTWSNLPVGRCQTVPIDEASLPDFLIEDTVNHPSHYATGEIECIDAIESSMTHEAFCGYLKGNVQKYMWRYENKGGLESLEKAQWYLNKLISRIS